MSVLFSVLAVYFHVLVGGWYSLILFIYLLLSKIPSKTFFLYLLIYIGLTAPIITYLAATYLIDNPVVIDGINMNWVYVFFRNPHHLDLITQIGEFGSSAQTGVILSLLCCALCLHILYRCDKTLYKNAARMSVIIFSQQFAGLSIALFDHTGAFLKFYPYRTSSLSFFLMFIILGIFMREKLFCHDNVRNGHACENIHLLDLPNILAGFMILFTLCGLSFNLYKNMRDSSEVFFPSPRTDARTSLYDWARECTPPDAVFLDLNMNARDDLDFIRRTERESFSVFKFIPTSNKLIYDWYTRVIEKKRAQTDVSYLHEIRKKIQNRLCCQ